LGLHNLANQIDSATGAGDEQQLGDAIAVIQISFKKASPTERAALCFFCANAHAGKFHIQNRRNHLEALDDLRKSELFYLRKAELEIIEHGLYDLLHDVFPKILTNIGGILSYVGRPCEAVEYWTRAIEIDPNFAMALGNRGYGLFYYAGILYDEGHRLTFLSFIKEDLDKALENGPEPRAIDGFKHCADQVTKQIEVYKIPTADMDSFSIGESKEEIAFRSWCLLNRLFLNPLNDLGAFHIAASDPLGCPSLSMSIEISQPIYHLFFNQLKQEFVTARFLLFEGLQTTETHFADRETYLHNSSDYPVYSIRAEKLKTSFRIAYSLFDKIAFMLNDYLELGITEKRISFRGIWYLNQDQKKDLLPQFKTIENWPLNGLLWLPKDLYSEEFQNNVLPEAKELHKIRNHIEHKNFKLISDMYGEIYDSKEFPDSSRKDPFAHALPEDQFKQKALRLLKMARSALIYLSLAMHLEEQKRDLVTEGMGVPMDLDTYSDDWKV